MASPDRPASVSGRPELSRTSAGTAALTERLAGALFPVAGKRTSSPELSAIFLLGTLAAFFRLGDVATRGNLWAEDGAVFLGMALHHNGIGSAFEPYAGYLNLVPRLLAMLAATLPLEFQGVAVNLAAATVQAGVAALAYVATSGFIRRRLWRALLSLAVIAVPVGPEVIDSIANLQWFLLFAGCICLLWTPRRPLGWGVLFLVLVATTTSSPFAVLILTGAACRVALQRSAMAALLFGVAAAGFVTQSMAIWRAPPRAGRNEIGMNLEPARLFGGFVRRVFGDGILGVANHRIDQPAPGLLAGASVMVLVVVLVVCLTTRDGFPALIRAGVLGVLAFLAYSMPVVASASLSTESPFFPGRYYVAPALLTITATLSLVAAATDRRAFPRVRVRPLAVVTSGALVLSLLWGLSSSWGAGYLRGRQHGPSWQPGIEQATTECLGSPARLNAKIAISPRGWAMHVPCERLRE
jgi:hypothetical protein